IMDHFIKIFTFLSNSKALKH
ncbi:hypothetical protein A5868_001855, partial [Enterococcus sp. 12F9_DIV0723]